MNDIDSHGKGVMDFQRSLAGMLVSAQLVALVRAPAVPTDFHDFPRLCEAHGKAP